jgi:CheY-like chemotaxis protein
VTETLRIVIVEDDVIIAMDMAELLIGLSHDVCAIATTEEEAIKAAEACAPNLMIVDGSLSKGSGVSAMQQILLKKFVPHIYVTGNPLLILDQLPEAVVITKPFTMKELTQGITRALMNA